MPVTRTCTPGTSAPLDRLSLEVATARSAPAAGVSGVQFGFCACAAEVETSGLYTPPTYCFADEAGH